MSLYERGQYVNRSFGSNNFHVSTNMEPNWRLCGLGKNSVIQLPFAEFPGKIQIQNPSTICIDKTTRLELLCKTNIFLTKESFLESLYLKLVFDNIEEYIYLKAHSDDIVSISHGRFLINLSSILLKK
ncbi:hypothetical protein HYG86_16310 [Alkalicella caledoniensis]|uniref:Uncharacterized protein n=1 Tax=Alkalicella caledoniensis TaxID=2731377 RepID=A0A7G9WC14_ALKCA|nr:hypothetical protein [Alkalicella caledoniensis]QNO16226.1 hypothetical protein HYG86_16310 [Alkalicella caledoniensis]